MWMFNLLPCVVTSEISRKTLYLNIKEETKSSLNNTKVCSNNLTKNLLSYKSILFNCFFIHKIYIIFVLVINTSIMEISKKIKKLRDTNGYSQDYIAEKIGISQAAYSKIESGQTNITIERANQLAKLYDIDTEYFFSSDDGKNIHYGQDNSYGPIHTNNNYFNDDRINELYSNLINEKNKIIQEYKEIINILRENNEIANKRINDLQEKIGNK